MHSKHFKFHSKVGAAPGSLDVHPDLAVQGTKLSVLAFDTADVIEADIKNPEEVTQYLKKYPVTWLNVSGLGNVEVLRKIIDVFNLHPLAMEDVVNVHQRIKVEQYEKEFFAVSKLPEMINGELHLQQVSMFWGKNYLLTFTENNTNCFDPLIIRIKHGGKRQRVLHSEYLAYAIIDVAVDSYFPIIDQYGTALDELEESAIENPSNWVLNKIHGLKFDLQALRRTIWGEREAISAFKEVIVNNKDFWFHVRDCEDHTIQLLDIIESYRDRTSSLMDIYLVSVNNRTNKIMKQLTIIATFCLPISMLAGIYGMNFDRSKPWNMPELGWTYGYEYFWAVVITFVITMLCIFWRKGWFKH